MVNRLDFSYESANINGTTHFVPQRWGQLFNPTFATYETAFHGIKATVYKPENSSTCSRGEVWSLESPSAALTLTGGCLQMVVSSGTMRAVKNGQPLIINEGNKISLTPGDTATLHPISSSVSLVVMNERATLGEAATLPQPKLFPPVTNEDVKFCRKVLGIPVARPSSYYPSGNTSAGYYRHKYAPRQ